MTEETKKKISHKLIGRKKSEETKGKMSFSMKGNRNGEGNRGKKYPLEVRKRMGRSKKGKHYSSKTEFKKGSTPWNKGKKCPEYSGEKNNKWKGGISKLPGYKNIFRRRHALRKLNASGSHTFGEWEELKARYNWTCPCCGKKEPNIKLTEDHIIPLSKGGSNNIENIQPLCKSCNCRKHTKIIKYKKLI